MRLPDDNNDKSGMTPTIVSTIVAVSMFVLVILVVVLYINHRQNPPGGIRARSRPPRQGRWRKAIRIPRI